MARSILLFAVLFLVACGAPVEGRAGGSGGDAALGMAGATMVEPSTGGDAPTGGASASTGGSSSSGGEAATGGAVATTGGEPSTGGIASTGGAPSTGGASETGGVAATGGSPSASGGAPCNGVEVAMFSTPAVGSYVCAAACPTGWTPVDAPFDGTTCTGGCLQIKPSQALTCAEDGGQVCLPQTGATDCAIKRACQRPTC